MTAVTPEKLEALAAVTPEAEIKKRPVFNKQKQKVGELDYVDARFVMDRLDTVVGPANWQDQYEQVVGGVKARVGILVQRDESAEPAWVWKEDVGTESTIEATKGSFSDAFKRACVKWGIARDLYDAREEDRSEAGHRPAGGLTTMAQATAATRPAQQAQPAQSGEKQRPFPVDPDDAPWVCPEHGAVVAFPAGVSAAGRAYDAFYACPEGRDCPHRAPRGLRVKPQHLVAQEDVVSADDEQEDLPF
jgi:hypothetical protein